jgi:cell pole-organizing protein PopZ
MSAVNINAADPEHEALRRAQRAHEPSMEEILASIRTIIAEEREPTKPLDSKPAPTRPAGSPVTPQVVYSKDEPLTQRSTSSPALRQAATGESLAPMVVWRKRQPETVEAGSTDESAGGAGPLLAPESEKAVASAFETLSASLAARNAELAEGAVREMLRPMLKTWLDENLPEIVERLVQAEIDRVVRGSR